MLARRSEIVAKTTGRQIHVGESLASNSSPKSSGCKLIIDEQ